jgi:hypothetical protein
MLLRRFYIQENENGMSATMKWNQKLTLSIAPNPKPKRNRELNTEFASDV